jgi:hypothetical protein
MKHKFFLFVALLVCFLGIATLLPSQSASAGFVTDYIITPNAYGDTPANDGTTHAYNVTMVTNPNGVKTTFIITSANTLWAYSEPAQTTVAFGTGTWEVDTHCKTQTTSGTITAKLYKVNANGTYEEFASNTATGLVNGFNDIDIQLTPGSDVTFTTGQRIGVRWSWNQATDLELYGNLIPNLDEAGNDKWDSGAHTPLTDPGYPTWELSTIILFGIGIIMIGGYVWFNKRKVTVKNELK